LVAVKPDITKAFDTLPHGIIGPALWRKRHTAYCPTNGGGMLQGCMGLHQNRRGNN